MVKYSHSEEKNKRRFFFLILSRVFIISIVLGTTAFIDFKRQTFEIPQITIHFFYLISAIVYLLSILYVILYRLKFSIKKNVVVQIVLDILLITGLIFNFGNTQIDFSLFYTLVIIYSVFFLGRQGALIVASVVSILYGLLLDFEFYKIMPFSSLIKYDYNLNAADVLTNIIVHITSFYVLAFLVSFVVEQERKAVLMLEERESEFNQLDVLFRSIVESIYTGVMTVDMNHIIKTFNKAAEDITGYSRKDVEGRKIEDLFPEFLPYLETDSSDHIRLNVNIRSKEGNKIHLGLSISSLKGRKENQIGYILVFQDLTRIHEMERIIEKNKNMAIIGEMAAGWAHEVRNPLAVIGGSIELLNQGLKLEGTNKRLMDIILRSKEQMENFARDFLLLARPVPLTKETVDVNTTIQEALEHLKMSPEWNDKILIETNFSGNVKAVANKEQVKQIINNILLNAVQSMDEKGILSIRTRTIATNDNKNYAEIMIKDTGCGIEKSDLDKIFEPFFTRKTKGTGLGLTIVSHIIEGYQGKIEIESEKNKGTTCIVCLPSAD